MKALSESAQKVKTQIEQAFSNLKPPGILAEERRFPDEEDLAIGRAFDWGRLNWQEVSCETLFSLYDYVSVRLVPEAIAYYLPAFMTCALDFYNCEFVGDWTLNRLSPPDSADEFPVQYFEAYAALFSREECAAITSFLEYLLLEYLIPNIFAVLPDRELKEADRAYELMLRRDRAEQVAWLEPL